MPSRANRRPVALFLVLSFAWAWGFWGYWVVAMPPGGLVLSPAFLVSAMIGGFAPSLAALLVLRLAGQGEARALLRRLADWSLPVAWYGFALFLAPMLAVLAWGLQSLVLGPLTWVDPVPLLPIILIWPLLAALGEELGWRGFLYPIWQSRFGAIGAALLLGLVWGIWHLPADFVGLKASGGWFWLAFLVNGPFVLTGHALVMAWLWQRTQKSLVAMVLYHLGITASAIPAPSAGTDPLTQIAAAAIGAALVWVLAIGLHLALPARRAVRPAG